jgi:sialidase-1
MQEQLMSQPGSARIVRPAWYLFIMVAAAATWTGEVARAAVAEAAPIWFIRDSQPVSIRTVGNSWVETPRGYAGHGRAQYLYAASSLEAGDFHIRGRLRIKLLAESAASFELDNSDFVFEGPGGEMMLRGPIAGAKSRKLGRAPRALRAGSPVDFEVIRRGDQLTIQIDNEEIVTVTVSEGPVERFGFRPWDAHMRITDFSAVGNTELRPVQWRLPWIDLATDASRQVLVERSNGLYLGHADTVLLADGQTMFVTYPLGHGGPGAILRRSTDGGRTWSHRLETPANWKTATNCPTIHRATGPDGVARLILFEGEGEMRQSISTDGGQTWTPLKPNGLHCVVAPMNVLPISGGRHLILYQWRGAVDGSAIYQAISDDGGQTWGKERRIADLAGASLCEPGPVLGPDGRRIAVLIRENRRRYHSLMIFSDDEGRSWTAPRAAPQPLTGDRHHFHLSDDGSLVCVFRDMAPGSPTKEDFVAWVGHWNDLRTGREGGYRIRLLDNPGRWKDTGYAGLEKLPDGTYVATTYVPLAPDERPSIVSVRFDLKELTPQAQEMAFTTQDIWVSGEGGYHTYRIPALLTATDGTLLAFCEGRTHSRHDAGDIDLLLRRSKDGGATWEPVQVIWDDGLNTAGNPCPVVDQRTGRIWMTSTRNLGGDTESEILTETADGTRTVWVFYSDDQGETWSKPREITKQVKRDNWTWYATGPGVGIQLESGRLVIPCDHAVSGTKKYGSHAIYSDDGGATWEIGGVISDRVNECQVVEMADGSLLLNMRSYHGLNRRAVARSTDGGLTWFGLWHDKALVEPVCQASFLRYSLERDPRYDRNRVLFLNPAAMNRRNMTLRLSYDEAMTWPVARVVHAGASAYSSIAVLPNGQIGTLYECGEHSPYEAIRFGRVDLRWLTDNTDSLVQADRDANAAARAE